MARRARSWTRPDLSIGLLLAATLAGCGAGGGGGGGFSRQGQLLGIRFPDPTGVNVEDERTPPQDAPLVQPIVLEFSEAPDPNDLHNGSVEITSSVGIPVPGTFAVKGTEVWFTPRLPLRPPAALDEDAGVYDGGGAGIQPGEFVSLHVGPSTWSFVASIAPSLLATFPDPSDATAVALVLRGTTDPDRMFRGLEPREPVAVSTTPGDGAVGVSPQMYTDPGALFPERAPYRVIYDGPILPAAEILDAFTLVDVDDTGSDPNGLPLGVTTTLVVNEPDRAVIEIQPSGILHFGHLLSLEQPSPLPGLSQDVPLAQGENVVLATFTVAEADETTVVLDQLYENFDSDARRDTDQDDLDPGILPAAWDQRDSNVLTAAFAFEGEGQLGRFVPAAPEEETRIILDTNRQVFPLFDGSTPDAPPGYEVIGGHFHFTDIDIPRKVILEIRGSNPLVLSATGTVKINGTIDVSGQNGGDDNSFDSGVTSMPGGAGGPGGGRGGVGHPILYFPPGNVSYTTLVSPPRGGNGYDAFNRETTGGQGGESGILDRPDEDKEYQTNQEIACNEFGFDNDSFAAAGGGGTFYGRGSLGRDGWGNVRPDGQGGWTVFRKVDDKDLWDVLNRGLRGNAVFRDRNQSNDFFGPRGEYQEVFGGEGGGGGGSRTEAYYCGVDCLTDSDPTNDGRCMGGEFGGSFADSVGDARGGGGGGAGGAIVVLALGTVEIKKNARLVARGGRGGGGEQLASSSWGGPGGGGSGGALVVQSAENITVEDGAKLDVTGGSGKGPDGAYGIVQLQVPAGKIVSVPNGAVVPADAWSDPSNQHNPAPFTAVSGAISTWYDMGRSIVRPPLAGPPPHFQFRGTNAFGFVRTDSDGNVLDPHDIDLRCDYLGQEDPLRPGHYKDGQEPRANFIPPSASVQVLFQGADAIAPGSKEIDPGSQTGWETDLEALSGHQFVRYQILFDIAKGSATAQPDSPRPSVQWISLPAEF